MVENWVNTIGGEVFDRAEFYISGGIEEDLPFKKRLSQFLVR